MAKAMSGNPSGPLNKTYVENRLNKIEQQKYQYYDGSSSIVGSPFYPNGKRNSQFTSPNFISNAVFYEPSTNLSLPKDQMYKTTTGMNHSASCDRLMEHRRDQQMTLLHGWSHRKNNLNIKNMTTYDVEIGTNINQVYMNNLKKRSYSAIPGRKLETKQNRPVDTEPVKKAANIERKDTELKAEGEEAHQSPRPEHLSKSQSQNSRSKVRSSKEEDRNLGQKLPPKAPMNQNKVGEQYSFPKEKPQIELYSEKSVPKSSRRSSKCSRRSSKCSSRRNSRADSASQNMRKETPVSQSGRSSQTSLQSYTDSRRSKNMKNKVRRNSRKGLRQSFSAFDIRNNNYDRISRHDSDIDSKDKSINYLEQVQNGDGWACMWLNHFKREQEMMNRRLNKYEDRNNMVMQNPATFGHDYEHLSNQRKRQLRKSNLDGGDGNEFVKNMSGCPVQKVHKLKTRKREKLKKYLLKHPLESNAYDKSILQGDGVGLNTTPDYNYYKILDREKENFKHEIQSQVRANKERKDQEDIIQRQDDQKNSKIYMKKMRIIDRLQNANIQRQRKGLRNDMNYLLNNQRLHSSFC
ncbi:unnamed protein product [Moneuplotes crassus]|uniref:Uncharacterized protein n=1 Tax=Euplotes crassus TaxID=5936 RepID=A0AAD1U4Y5_EUPCR|nr:unnamed protein product [Moneuplotes crassus]